MGRRAGTRHRARPVHVKVWLLNGLLPDLAIWQQFRKPAFTLGQPEVGFRHALREFISALLSCRRSRDRRAFKDRSMMTFFESSFASSFV